MQIKMLLILLFAAQVFGKNKQTANTFGKIGKTCLLRARIPVFEEVETLHFSQVFFLRQIAALLVICYY